MKLLGQRDDGDGEVARVEGGEYREEAYRQASRVLFKRRPILSRKEGISAMLTLIQTIEWVNIIQVDHWGLALAEVLKPAR